jgi:hypothetical protein
MKAADVVTAIRRRYGCETDDIGPEWAALDEMDLQPGYSTRRVDLLAIRAWSGRPKGHERHAIEVKVSRADLRRELAQPEKWQAWAAVTHRFYLAVPAALNLDGFELPGAWGVLSVTAQGVRQTRRAPRRDPEPLPHAVTVEAFRRASRAEARIRQADGDDLAAQVAGLTRDLASRDRQIATARTAEDRWRSRCDDVMQLLARGSTRPRSASAARR